MQRASAKKRSQSAHDADHPFGQPGARFWNEKLKEGKGDWDSTSSYGLGDVHNALAVLQLAADYLKEAEGDVTREA